MAYKGYNPKNNKYVNTYNQKHYKRITVNFPIEFFTDELQPHCDALGISVHEFIKKAVSDAITKKEY